jgi:predicted ATPase
MRCVRARQRDHAAMRIKLAAVRNFRRLEDVAIEFSDVTTFLGPNGAGKSTILPEDDVFQCEADRIVGSSRVRSIDRP